MQRKTSLFANTKREAIVALSAAVAAASVLYAPQSEAQESSITYQVRSASVVVNCPMTIGGSFDARTTALTGELHRSGVDPETIAGELQVDATTIDTGIGLRNRHLREKYLEVGRGDDFATIRLTELKLTGAGTGPLDGELVFTATLVLHGERKPVRGTVEIRPVGDGYRVKGSFPVSIPEFAIPKPRHLGVGVKDEVRVEVEVDLARVAAAMEASS